MGSVNLKSKDLIPSAASIPDLVSQPLTTAVLKSVDLKQFVNRFCQKLNERFFFKVVFCQKSIGFIPANV